MSDDDALPGVTVVDAPSASTVIGAAPSAIVVHHVEPTIVMEGSSEPPSSLRLSDRSSADSFDATIHGTKPWRITVAMFSTVLALASALSPLTGPSSDAWCGVIALLAVVAAPLLMLWTWALAKSDVTLDAQTFTVVSKATLGNARYEFDSREIHGFGYQRSPSRPWRFELVVVFRAGWTTRVPLACTRRDEVRFIARRLNASLALLQRWMTRG